MRFASFQQQGRTSWGLIMGEEVADLGALEPARFPDLRSAIAANALPTLAARADEAQHYGLATVVFLPVVPNPDKILCIGLNYEEHRRETGRSEVANPTVFGRFNNSQTGHLVPIAQPRVSTKVDFEGELAIVIAKPGRYIAAADAFDYVAGYSIYNDVSIRDFQAHTHQFTPGKNFPGTGAFGPWMVTPNEMGAIGPQRIATRVNGDTVQSAVFDQMIFDVARIIEYCSSFTKLEAGDVIASGTPGGVGAKRTPPLWLKPGDVVDVEIEGIGVLSNPIVAE